MLYRDKSAIQITSFYGGEKFQRKQGRLMITFSRFFPCFSDNECEFIRLCGSIAPEINGSLLH